MSGCDDKWLQINCNDLKLQRCSTGAYVKSNTMSDFMHLHLQIPNGFAFIDFQNEHVP